MTIADPKVGGWADHEVLTHAQMNAIRAGLLQAVDGVGGGTYTLGAFLRFDGAELRAGAGFALKGGQLTIDAGTSGLVNNDTSTFNDACTFNGANTFVGDADFQQDTIFRPSNTNDFKAGSTIIIRDLDDLTVDAQTVSLRVPLVPLFNIRDAAGLQQNWHFDISVGGWLDDQLGESLYFMLPIMAGDVLNSVSATVAGDFTGGASHGVTDPANKMRLRVLEGPAATGAYTAIATQVDAATGAAYDAAHLLTASASSYTALDRPYVIEMRAESGANSFANANALYHLRASVVRNRVVSQNTFGS